MRFADTTWWVPWSLPSDRNHGAAVEATSSLDKELVLTSNHVLGETWTVLRRTAGHQTAAMFLDRIDQLVAARTLVLVDVDGDTEAAAWWWLREHDERGYSFVDATSFAVMRARKIRRALALGGAFESAGFEEIR